jgi:drug/metabolite transporter (DMT)-like permease
MSNAAEANGNDDAVSQPTSRSAIKRSVWIAFCCLCLLSASAWAAMPFGSSALPPLEQLAVLYLAIGLSALLVSGRSWWKRMRSRPWAALVIASVMFFGAPALALELASGAVPEITRSALFALVPIVVAITTAAVDVGTPGENGARRSLLPALLGLAGLLLLLPLSFSLSPKGTIMLAILCAAVLLAGISSVWLYRLVQRHQPADAAAMICLSNAFFLLACGQAGQTFIWGPSSLVSMISLSTLVNLIEILLLLWLVRTLSPVRFAARFLIIPLLTVLEAYVLLRPQVTLRIGGGVAALVVGAATLVLANPHRDEPELSLR